MHCIQPRNYSEIVFLLEEGQIVDRWLEHFSRHSFSFLRITDGKGTLQWPPFRIIVNWWSFSLLWRRTWVMPNQTAVWRIGFPCWYFQICSNYGMRSHINLGSCRSWGYKCNWTRDIDRFIFCHLIQWLWDLFFSVNFVLMLCFLSLLVLSQMKSTTAISSEVIIWFNLVLTLNIINAVFFN